MSEKKGRNKAANLSKKHKIILCVVAIIVVLVGGVSAYAISLNNINNEWEDKIYPGVVIKDTDIGGKTKEEAKKIISKKLSTIKNKDIIVKVQDKEYKTDYKVLSPSWNIDKALEEALSFGKEGNLFSKNAHIKHSNKEKHNIDIELKYNEKKFKELVTEIEDYFLISPIDATLEINGKNFTIVPEKNGYKLDKKELTAELRKAIDGELNKKSIINMDYITAEARIKESDLKKIKGVMSTYSDSSFGFGYDGRRQNIRIATELVNGTILMPGDEFSYSKTSQKGKDRYEKAGVYVGNEIQQAEGGGICQVSTALYRAVMRANIRSTERLNHSMTVGYSKPGLDATVAWGWIDYKFKNTYDFPIYIQGSTDNGVLTFNIYGDKDAMEGKTYELVNEIIKTIPSPVKEIKDSSLPEGKRVVVSQGMTGYVAKSYQVTYENGKEIKKEYIATDNYQATETVVKVGTKKVTDKKK